MDSNTLGSVWIIGTHNFSLSLEYQPWYLATQSSITCLLEAIPSFLVAAKSPTASGPYSVLYWYQVIYGHWIEPIPVIYAWKENWDGSTSCHSLSFHLMEEDQDPPSKSPNLIPHTPPPPLPAPPISPPPSSPPFHQHQPPPPVPISPDLPRLTNASVCRPPPSLSAHHHQQEPELWQILILAMDVQCTLYAVQFNYKTLKLLSLSQKKSRTSKKWCCGAAQMRNWQSRVPQIVSCREPSQKGTTESYPKDHIICHGQLSKFWAPNLEMEALYNYMHSAQN